MRPYSVHCAQKHCHRQLLPESGSQLGTFCCQTVLVTTTPPVG